MNKGESERVGERVRMRVGKNTWRYAQSACTLFEQQPKSRELDEVDSAVRGARALPKQHERKRLDASEALERPAELAVDSGVERIHESHLGGIVVHTAIEFA